MIKLVRGQKPTAFQFELIRVISETIGQVYGSLNLAMVITENVKGVENQSGDDLFPEFIVAEVANTIRHNSRILDQKEITYIFEALNAVKWQYMKK